MVLLTSLFIQKRCFLHQVGFSIWEAQRRGNLPWPWALHKNKRDLKTKRPLLFTRQSNAVCADPVWLNMDLRDRQQCQPSSRMEVWWRRHTSDSYKGQINVLYFPDEHMNPSNICWYDPSDNNCPEVSFNTRQHIPQMCDAWIFLPEGEWVWRLLWQMV